MFLDVSLRQGKSRGLNLLLCACNLRPSQQLRYLLLAEDDGTGSKPVEPMSVAAYENSKNLKSGASFAGLQVISHAVMHPERSPIQIKHAHFPLVTTL